MTALGNIEKRQLADQILRGSQERKRYGVVGGGISCAQTPWQSQQNQQNHRLLNRFSTIVPADASACGKLLLLRQPSGVKLKDRR
jgi:hypothetical protein